MEAYGSVEVFSATKAKDRKHLGEVVTTFLRDNRDLEVVGKEVRLSSDRSFHCLTIVLFFREAL